MVIQKWLYKNGYIKMVTQKNRNILSIVIGTVVILLLIYISDIKGMISILSDINPMWIILAVLIYNVNWILRGYRWQTILKYMGYKIKLKDSVSLTIIGNFINLVTPAKIGDFARALILKKNNNADVTKGLSSVIVDRVLDLFVVTILAYISFSIISRDMILPEWIKILVDNSIYILIIGLIIIGIIFNFVRRSKYISKYLPLDDIGLICHPRKITKLIIVSVTLWIFEMSTIIILFRALDLDINIILIMAAIMVANLTKALPLTPGGIGAYEGSIAIVLMVGGLPYTTGLTIGILEHGIKNVYTILFGILSLSYSSISIGNIVEFKKLRSCEKDVG